MRANCVGSILFVVWLLSAIHVSGQTIKPIKEVKEYYKSLKDQKFFLRHPLFRFEPGKSQLIGRDASHLSPERRIYYRVVLPTEMLGGFSEIVPEISNPAEFLAEAKRRLRLRSTESERMTRIVEIPKGSEILIKGVSWGRSKGKTVIVELVHQMDHRQDVKTKLTIHFPQEYYPAGHARRAIEVVFSNDPIERDASDVVLRSGMTMEEVVILKGPRAAPRLPETSVPSVHAVHDSWPWPAEN